MKSEKSQVVIVPAQTWAFVGRRSRLGPAEISACIDGAFAELTEAIARAGVRTNGPPRAHYHYRDGDKIGFDLVFSHYYGR